MTNAEKHQEGMTLLKMLLTFIISIVSLCKKNRDCDPDSKSDPENDPDRDSDIPEA